MAPRSSQKPAPTPGSQNKTSQPAKRPKLKVGSLNTGSSDSVKRLDPLNAFANLPTSQPKVSLSQTQTQSRPSKNKGKGKEKEIEVIDVDAIPESTAAEETVVAEEDRLWVDLYEPTFESELAVHVKKVEDVRRWLLEAFEGGPTGKLRKYRRLLVLTGPAGTAKTTTIKVLSREMNFEIMEWRNAMSDPATATLDADLRYSSDSRSGIVEYDYESSYTKFEAFMTRATSCLNVFSSSSAPSTSKDKRRLILLEDLPNLGHLETRYRFHAALKTIVEVPDQNPVPIIIIASDSGLRGEAGDERLASGMWRKDQDGAVDLYSILSKDLLNSPYTIQIRFNPIAPTLLKKALQALLNTHYSSARTKSPITAQLLDVVIESANGDIRSAIMTLQFACIRLGSQAATKAKGRKKEGKLHADVLMESITRREQSLVLFHLMGKVLFNKRKGDPPATSALARDIKREEELDRRLKDPPPLPPHLEEEHYRKTSRVDIDRIYADSPIDSSLFSLYIHQNYTSFTNDDLERCRAVSEWLSWADSSGGEAWYQVNPHRFHLLALGTLHSLPHPVERKGQRVFKPEFFDFLQKEKDAWEGVRDVRAWVIRQAQTQKEEEEDTAMGWDMSRWTPTLIATELGAALRTMDNQPQRQRMHRAPVTHRRFSVLHYANIGTRLSELGENEALEGEEYEEGGLMDEEAEDEEAKRAHLGGWLDSDDIEEF